MNNIIFKQCNSSNYTVGRTKDIKYIVIHYTANNGDTALGNANYFANNSNLNASAHYFVDEGNTYYQSVKESNTVWHCGASTYKHPTCRNDNSIGVELCSRKTATGAYYFKEETVSNAAELVKYLMNLYNIPAENVIRHYDVTGKICPAPFVNDITAWNVFKGRLIVAKGDDEVVDTVKININGKEYTFDRILKDGKNYVCLSDFKQAGFDVGYNETTKVPSFGVSVLEDTFKVNGEDTTVHKIMKNDENYVRVRDLDKVIDISWDGVSKTVVINRK